MAFVNFATREITAKIVYYGPGLGGKTTSLQYIHGNLAPENRGKMISLATEEDRTIYFDFLPLNLGKIQDFAVRVQLYTVPGQVRYNATRKLVLRGADGLVFVADSQKHKKLANLESFNNMEENLRELSKDLRELPHILQFNKVDLTGIMGSEELSQILNKYNVPFFETVATTGIGVLDALKSVTKLVFNDLSKKALLQKKSRSTLSGGIPPSSPSTEYTLGSSYAAAQPAAAAVVKTPPPPPAPLEPPQPPEPHPSLSSYYSDKMDEPDEIMQDDLIDKMEDSFSDSTYSELELEDEVEDSGVSDNDYSSDLNRIAEVEPIEEFDEPATEISPIEPSRSFDDVQGVEGSMFDIPPDESIPGEEEAEFSVEEPIISVPIVPMGADVEAVEANVEPPDSALVESVTEEPMVEPVAPPASAPEVIAPPAAPATQAVVANWSYAQFFSSSKELSDLIGKMENQIALGDGSGALGTARTAYEFMMRRLFPDALAMDDTEISRVLALDLKFKRFVRFKSLLWGEPTPANLLLVHHFLGEVYLALQEL